MQLYLNFCLCIGNVDYNSTQVQLAFQPTPNTEPQCIDVPIIGDSILENNETFYILLSTLDSDVSISPNLGTVVIIDNDGRLITL